MLSTLPRLLLSVSAPVLLWLRRLRALRPLRTLPLAPEGWSGEGGTRCMLVWPWRSRGAARPYTSEPVPE